MDPLLAILHHFAAFGIVTAMAVELTMLRGTLDAPRLARLVGVDRLYALVALLLVAVGTARVVWSPKGAAFYVGNPVFWIKMACFAAIALASIPATRRFVAWANAGRADPSFVPPAAEVAAARRAVFWSSHLVVPVLVTAPLMARGIGFG